MNRSRHIIRSASLLLAGTAIALTMGACSSSEESVASAQTREAGAYRDSRVCVKNSSSEDLDVGPARDTVGTFATLAPGGRQCFESNDTADAVANVSIVHSDDAYVIASAENFLIWAPKFRLCTQQVGESCRFNSPRPFFEATLKIGTTGDVISAQGHTYQPRRLADDTYWIVYEVEVTS